MGTAVDTTEALFTDSDASQEEEVLGLLAKNLAQLYRTQATMRRTSWTFRAAS